MKKLAIFLTGIVLVLGGLAACLNPTNFDANVGINITGNINTKDVTSAVLLLTNKSKTVDVTKVTISREPNDNESVSLMPVTSFANQPKRLTKKAQYLDPCDKSYTIVIEYDYFLMDKPNEKEGSAVKTVVLPLPLPKEIEEVLIYRDKNGEVVVYWTKEDKFPAPDADPNDTADLKNVKNDPYVGEGSTLAVIPPEYRNRMATFVIMNRTNSQVIDSVTFTQNERSYTIGPVNVHDKLSIALGQGQWTTSLKYAALKYNTTRAGGEDDNYDESREITLGPFNSIVVPSNDPQAVKEHYLHFYLKRDRGYNYAFEFPPLSNDYDEKDLLPPDNGYGRGLIVLRNDVPASSIESITLYNERYPQYQPLTITNNFFIPASGILYDHSGSMDVTGTVTFPIDALSLFTIEITYITSAGPVMVKRVKVPITDRIEDITVKPTDEATQQGAKVMLQNATSNYPVDIIAMTVQNRENLSERSYYTPNTWNPHGSIIKGRSAIQYVMSSIAMPVTEGAEFEATVFIQANGQAAMITKDMGELYSDDIPEQNLKTITITDSDIPPSLRPGSGNGGNGGGGYEDTSGVGAIITLKNETNNCPVEIFGLTVQNIITGEISSYGTTVWAPQGVISRGNEAVQRVMSSPTMPITSAGQQFVALITIQASGKAAMIIKEIGTLYSTNLPDQNPKTITVTDADVPEEFKSTGAKVTLKNDTNNNPVQIVGLTVRNKFTGGSSSYDTASWTPKTAIARGGSAVQYVFTSAVMPITPSVNFEAQLLLQASVSGVIVTAMVTKDFYSGSTVNNVLYSASPPDGNLRTVTITDADIPDELRSVGAKVTVRNSTTAPYGVTITGMTVRNRYTGDSSYYGTATWTPRTEIAFNNSAVQYVLSSMDMPITPAAAFEALIFIQVTIRDVVRTAVITKNIEGSLHSTNPDGNAKTVTVTDSDVPDDLKPGGSVGDDIGAKVTLRNNTNNYTVSITGLTVRNISTGASSYYGTTTWGPQGEVAKGANAVQYVLSSTAMPITAGASFEALITVRAPNGNTAAITRDFEGAGGNVLYSANLPGNNTRTLTVTDADVPDDLKNVGAKVTLRNDTNNYPVNITGAIVRNKSTGASSYYGTTTWMPEIAIAAGRSAVQYVLSTTAMPITAGANFEILITIQAAINGVHKAAIITKDIPGALYSANPDGNPKTITVGDADIPDDFKNIGAKVTLKNNTSNWPVEITGFTVRNKAMGASTSYGPATWAITPAGNIGPGGKDAVQYVLSSSTMPITSANSGLFEALITMQANGKTATKTMDTGTLYSTDPGSNTKTLTVSDSDVPEELKNIGARVTVKNATSAWPVEITGFTVRNKTAAGQSSFYDPATWSITPANTVIGAGKEAVQDVMSSTSMPITSAAAFEARIVIRANGNTATITRAFSPETLYNSSGTPAANTRTLTIADTDVPDELKSIGAKVTLRNSTSSYPVQITGLTVRNKTTGASSYYGITSWAPQGSINRPFAALQDVLSSASMPITAAGTFEALVLIQAEGKAAIVTKDFFGTGTTVNNTLYSTTPAANTRTVVIEDSDVPAELRPGGGNTGSGAGALVTLKNSTTASFGVTITAMTVQDKADTGKSASYGTTTWTDNGAIAAGKEAEQLVLNSAGMPITSASQNFAALITIQATVNGFIKTATITRDILPAPVYSVTPGSNVKTITITDSDVPEELKNTGAKVTILNNTPASFGVSITGMTVRNKADTAKNTSYGSASWTPGTNIGAGSNAVQYVMTSSGMPVTSGVNFEAALTIQAAANGTVKTMTVTRDFVGGTGNVLYSANPPDSNARTVTIAEADIPEDFRNIGAKVTMQNSTTAAFGVSITALTVQNKANISQNRTYDRNTWSTGANIGANGNAVQYVMTSTAMPISSTAAFEARITVQAAVLGTVQTATITKAFSPETLYGTPDSNARTLAITDSDVPDHLKNIGAKVTIQNNTSNYPVEITGMTVRNKADTGKSKSYGSATWSISPAGNIGSGKSAVQYVMTSAEMPITSGVNFEYLIAIQAAVNGEVKSSAITRDFSPAALYSTSSPDSNTRTIAIVDSDIPEDLRPVIGARVTLQNNTTVSLGVAITNMTIRNKTNTSQSASYGSATWTISPAGNIGSGKSAVQDVLSSAGMPITSAATFEAVITLAAAVNGAAKSVSVTKAFSPETLYSTAPAANTRTITITDSDVPEELKNIGAKVTVQNSTTSSLGVTITGMAVQNTVTAAQNSVYGPGTWMPGSNIGAGSSAVQYVMSSTNMPVTSANTSQFEAKIAISANGRTATIVKALTGMYSTNPDSNAKTITITDTDVPNDLKIGAKVTVQNSTTAALGVTVTNMTVRNADNTSQSTSYSTGTWTPDGAIPANKNAVQFVMSSTAMPITSGASFRALITLQVTINGAAQTATIEKDFITTGAAVNNVLYSANPPDSNTRTVTVADSDVPENLKNIGAKVTVQNSTAAALGVTVTGITVRNKLRPAQSSVCGSATWMPPSNISAGSSAVQYVMTSAAMPLLPTEPYEAVITMTGNGKTATVTRDFVYPGNNSVLNVLYPFNVPPDNHMAAPDENTRTITITDSDIPENLKPLNGVRLELRNNTTEDYAAYVYGIYLEAKGTTTPSVWFGHDSIRTADNWTITAAGPGIFEPSQNKTVTEFIPPASLAGSKPVVMPRGGKATVDIITQAYENLSIAAGVEYQARVYMVSVENGWAATVKKDFIMPSTNAVNNVLYSTALPAGNTRYVALEDADVPARIRPNTKPEKIKSASTGAAIILDGEEWIKVRNYNDPSDPQGQKDYVLLLLKGNMPGGAMKYHSGLFSALLGPGDESYRNADVKKKVDEWYIDKTSVSKPSANEMPQFYTLRDIGWTTTVRMVGNPQNCPGTKRIRGLEYVDSFHTGDPVVDGIKTKYVGPFIGKASDFMETYKVGVAQNQLPLYHFASGSKYWRQDAYSNDGGTDKIGIMNTAGDIDKTTPRAADVYVRPMIWITVNPASWPKQTGAVR